MNKIFKTVWNQATSSFVAASELAKGYGASSLNVQDGNFEDDTNLFAPNQTLKPLYKAIALGFGAITLILTSQSIFAGGTSALPTGGVVASGSASIASSGSVMTIKENTNQAAINWQTFGIGQSNTVNILQPSSTSVLLNRVIGADPSDIYGSLNANGQVFLVNPNGILFAPGSSVNVGGLVASTLGLTDSAFAQGNATGKYWFSGSSIQSVSSQGNINADGGYVALLGAKVSNQGTITSRLGSVAMTGGSAVTLDIAGDRLINVAVDQGAVNALLENGGIIKADGGQVVMTTQAAGQLLSTVVNNTGLIQAQTIDTSTGTIKLLGDMQSGLVKLSGKLDASAPNSGNGGNIETSAANVKISDNYFVTTIAPKGATGNWLIDPADYTIASYGGDQTGTQIANSLATTNLTIISSVGKSPASGDTSNAGGNINVNDNISWSSNSKLTLTASNNININSNVSATGNSAGINLNYNTSNGEVQASGSGGLNFSYGHSIGLSGSAPTLSINGSSYTIITGSGLPTSFNDGTFLGINGNLSGKYALGAPIDFSTFNSLFGSASPIGNSTTPFQGVLEGLGNSIKNALINTAKVDISNVGIFGYVGSAGIVRNLNLSNALVYGLNNAGGIAGYNAGNIINSTSSSSTISYTSSTSGNGGGIGGLVGFNAGNIINSASTMNTVSGNHNIGGLTGNNSSSAVISGSFSANNAVSGLVFGNTQSYNIGGLIGGNSGSINNSYASDVYGLSSVASSTISGYNGVGGLVGYNFSGTITNSYSTLANISATTNKGGLVGANTGTVTNSYWDSSTSGISSGTSGLGLTSSALYSQSSYLNWDFTNTWVASSSFSYPILRSFLTPLVLYAPIYTKTYDGTKFALMPGTNIPSGTIGDGLIYSSGSSNLIKSELFSNPVYSGGFANSKNAGTYTINASGVFSNQIGYLISFIPGSLTINPKPLTGTIAAGSSTYGSSLVPGSVTLSGKVGNDSVNAGTVTINTAGNTSSSGNLKAGSYTGIELVGSTLSGADAANYTFSGATGNYTVTPLQLTGTIASSSSTYGSTLNPGSVIFGNIVSGDDVSAVASVNTSTTSAAGKPVAGTYTQTVGTSLSGTDAVNYTFVGVRSGANYTINPLTITGTIATGSSTYGATLAPGVVSLNGVIGADQVNVGSVTVSTIGNTSTAGKLKAGSYTGIESVGATLSGNDAGNYSFAGATGDYNVAQLALSVIGETAANKTYNASTAATINTASASLSGVFSGDTVTLNTSGVSGTFASPNAGTGIAVAVTGNAISGASASNYTVTQPTGLAANITPATLAVAANSLVSLFGMADPALTYSSSGYFSTDSATNILSGALSRSAGQAAGNYSISLGTLASSANYSIAYTAGNLKILPQVLSGDSSSFPFAAPTNNAVMTSKPTAAPVLFAVAKDLPEVKAVTELSSNLTTTKSLTPRISASPNDWDKLIVMDGGLRLPQEIANTAN